MKPDAAIETEKSSECRALVPLTAKVSGRAVVTLYRPNAAFVTQLSANVKGFSAYRAKRRVKPEVGASRYRTTIADALAYQRKGQKLNYCA